MPDSSLAMPAPEVGAQTIQAQKRQAALVDREPNTRRSAPDA